MSHRAHTDELTLDTRATRHIEQLIGRVARTPSYIYDIQSLRSFGTQLHRMAKRCGIEIYYFEPSNRKPEILALLASLGFGATVSQLRGIKRALQAGFSPDSIQLSGFGLDRDDLSAALGRVTVNVGSKQELLWALAHDASVKIGLRVHNGIDPLDKRGISFDDVIEILRSQPDRIRGLHCYIGTNISDPSAHVALAERLADITARAQLGTSEDFYLNLGGGFSGTHERTFDWRSLFERLSALRAANTRLARCKYVLEAGRAVVAGFGVFVARVLFSFDRGPHRYVVVDANISQFPRPVRYGFHKEFFPFMDDGIHPLSFYVPVEKRVITTLSQPKSGTRSIAVVGNSHYSKDWFAIAHVNAADLPLLNDALVVFEQAGAYCESMSDDWADDTPAASIVYS